MSVGDWYRALLKDEARKKAAAAKAARFGVYQHANWDHATGQAVETGTGYVVREMTAAVPYAKMKPVAVYKRKTAAQKRADKLNGETQ